MIATRDGHSCFLGGGTSVLFTGHIRTQGTPIEDNIKKEPLVKFHSFKKSYHTRSVKPLKRCIVGGQLLSMERMHSR